ncbi:DoxX family protein [Pelagicoccus mobilis]|uniref:DoxX family protein n=2 Tax=Pelagicoccus mobilis TaxID=415221 RepID=A0A934RV64_9BACT|nr:DoxX family protein [Pelagicoccus mobilis]MBK1876988.1 DoxX family protein [Pelagicoccus mobilis]
MREEFEAYGLPATVMLTIGLIKLALATALIVGIWIPSITAFAAAGLAITLLAAVIAHLRIHDPLKKSIPAATLMTMATALLIL